MHSLRHRLFDLACATYKRYAGTLQHLTEAGFMALFGLPLTHEDQPDGRSWQPSSCTGAGASSAPITC